MAVVFISHSSRDNDKVQEIVQAIGLQGFDSIFLDHDEIKGIKSGEHWEQRLYGELKRSHAILLLLSPSWIDSKWCDREYSYAKALGKEIIPIIIDQGRNNEVDQWIDSYLQKSDLTKDANALSRVIDRLKEVSLDTQQGFEWDRHRSPYPGMVSFEEEDAAIFFGREEETREVIEKLNAMKNRNAPKLLNIVAASGMGKSSFLKAGVIPHIKRSYGERWIVLPILRPTKRPLYEFTKLLAYFLKQESKYKAIYESLKTENYQEFIDDIITQIEFISPRSSILLPVDQAEEFYSIEENSGERKQLFKILSYLFNEKEKFFCIWTLRADFLKKLQVDKRIQPIYKHMELFALMPMPKENIASIIIKPAITAGINIDKRLIEKVKEDIQTTDALPLLALVLNELFVKSSNKKHLTLQEYQNLTPNKENPLEHIIAQKAQEAIGCYLEDSKQLNILKEAFIPRLVHLDSHKNEYYKIIALWDELPPTAYAMLDALVNARLLIKKNDGDNATVEIVHEALIRKWPLLQTWLEEEREFLLGKTQLEIAYSEYKKYKKDNAQDKHKTYLTELRLQKASAWMIENPQRLDIGEREYIKESITFESKQTVRKKRISMAIFGVVLLFGLFSAWEWSEARNNLKVAVDERERANKNENIALGRLKTIEQQKNNTIANYWVMMLYEDAKDGQIDKLGRLTDILKYLDANDTKKDFALNILSEYFSKKGLDVKFENKELNDFDKQFTEFIFRKGKYTSMELELSLSRYIWLWKKDQIRALHSLINALLSDHTPMIFQRYKALDKMDRKKLEYVSLMLKFVDNPTEDTINQLSKYDFFTKKSEYSVFSGIESLLQPKAHFLYAGDRKYIEFTKENWAQLTTQAVDKFVGISRVLYKHSYKYPKLYTKEEKESIENYYFEGVFEMNFTGDNNETVEKTDAQVQQNNASLHKEKIELLGSNWQTQEIKKELKAILSIQPDNYWALKTLSYIYFLDQEKDKYTTLIQKMIKLFPTEKKNLESRLKIFDFVSENNTTIKLTNDEKKHSIDYCQSLSSYSISKNKYGEGIRIYQNSFDANMSDTDKVDYYGQLSWYYLFVDYHKAIESAKLALKLDPTKKWILMNLAHGYLLSGDIQKAKKIYLENKGISIHSTKRIWEEVIVEDFDILRKHSIDSPYFKEIEKLLPKSTKKDDSFL